jgi:hypothetical protein
MQASYLTIAALVLAGACAKTEQPAPNKNTNWLRECTSDEQCGGELSCLSGICTVECEDDGACTSAGGGAHCEAEVCVSDELREDDAGLALDSGPAPEPPCMLVDELCAEVVAQSQGVVSSIAVQGDRVYWLSNRHSDDDLDAEDGALESALITGGGVRTLATGLRAPTELRLDATHAYAVLAANTALPPYDRIVRVPLAGGEPELLLTEAQQVTTIQIDDTHLYWLGNHDVGYESETPEELIPSTRIYRLPKDGAPGPSLETVQEHFLVDTMPDGNSGLAVASDTVYWREGPMIRAIDLASFETRDVVDANNEYSSSSQGLAVSGDELIWIWGQDEMGGVSTLDLSTADAMAIQSDPVGGGPYAAYLVADEQNIYWSHDIGFDFWMVHRTDRSTGESFLIANSDLLRNVQIAVGDDYLFMSITHLSRTGMSIDMVTSYVVRVPKDT